MANLAPVHASPSDADNLDLINKARKEQLSIQVEGAFGVAVQEPRRYIREPGRIMGVSLFRRTAGDTGATTTVDVLKNGSSILKAKVDFDQGDGGNLQADGVLDTTHGDFDGDGITVDAGDYLEIETTAEENAAGSAKGLSAEFDFLRG